MCLNKVNGQEKNGNHHLRETNMNTIQVSIELNEIETVIDWYMIISPYPVCVAPL